MVRERFTFILICSILTSSIAHSSKAVEVKILASNYKARNITEDFRRQDRGLERLWEQNKRFSLASSEQTPTVAQQQFIQSDGIIDRRWGLAAMAVTSAISLLLVWILFRKPSQKVILISPAGSRSPQESKSKESNELASLPSLPNYLSRNLNVRDDSPQYSQSNVNLVNLHEDLDVDLVAELIRDLQQDRALEIKLAANPSQTRRLNLRREAIWKLTQVGDYRSIEPLAKIIPHVNSLDKSLILEAITKISHRSFKPIDRQLLALLEDEDPAQRKSAIKDSIAIYKFVIPITKRLTQMQSDIDPEVRSTAVQALRQLGLYAKSNSYAVRDIEPALDKPKKLHKMASQNREELDLNR